MGCPLLSATRPDLAFRQTFQRTGGKHSKSGSRILGGVNYRSLFDRTDCKGIELHHGQDGDVTSDAHQLVELS